MRRHSSGYDFLFCIALLATLIALVPAAAHLFELPRKIALSQERYFTVQQIYAGWDLFGIALVIQCIAMVLLTWRSAGEYYVFRPVLVALVLMLAAQALFWLFSLPADSATHNWTQAPQDWAMLRHQWEYSHAAGALCQFASLCCLIAALFARIRASGR
jgi:hypothetical protein